MMTSCVYLRLNTLRKHLAKFETYCTFENQNGPAILFNKPSLKAKDAQWLLGLPPSEKTSAENEPAPRTCHTWTFQKLWPDEQLATDEDFSIVIQCTFNKEQRMTVLAFPGGMAGIIDEQMLNQLFEKSTAATNERKENQSSWQTGAGG